MSVDAAVPVPAVPAPKVLAAEWLFRYTRAFRPLYVRALGVLPLIAVPLAVLSTPLVRLIAFVVLAAWLLSWTLLSLRSARRGRPLLAQLTVLASFPEPTSERHLKVVACVLAEAHPALTRLQEPTEEQVSEVLQDAALRLFVRADVAGCANGHLDVCAHRRNGDAWLRWLAPEEFDSTEDVTDGAAGGTDPVPADAAPGTPEDQQ